MKNKKPSIVNAIIKHLLGGMSIDAEIARKDFSVNNFGNVLNRIRMQGYDLQECKNGEFYLSQDSIVKGLKQHNKEATQ